MGCAGRSVRFLRNVWGILPFVGTTTVRGLPSGPHNGGGGGTWRYDPGPPPSRGEGVACSVRTQCKVLVYQFTRAFLHVSMPHGQNTLFFFALLTIVIFRGALHQVQPSATTPLGDPCGMGVGVWNDVDGPQCTTQVSRPPPPSHPWEGREVAEATVVSRGTTVPLSHRIPPWLLGSPVNSNRQKS